VSKKDLIATRIPKLSAAFRKFWGPPPLLGFESEEAYWSFAAAIVAEVDPSDVVMLLIVKDFVDHSFEVRELRKHKGRLMELERANQLAALARKTGAADFSSPLGETQLFLASMTYLNAIEPLIADAERRRDDALDQLLRYGDKVVDRLRQKAETATIDGEVVLSAPMSRSVPRLTEAPAEPVAPAKTSPGDASSNAAGEGPESGPVDDAELDLADGVPELAAVVVPELAAVVAPELAAVVVVPKLEVAVDLPGLEKAADVTEPSGEGTANGDPRPERAAESAG
jgi:hypothetical protein